MFGARVERSGVNIAQFRAQKVLESWSEQAAPFAMEGLRREAPYRQAANNAGHTHLRDSIVMRRQSTSGGVRLEFVSMVPHARFVVEGTKAHVILPRNRSVLRFEKDGQIIFARRVNHPGTKANPFPERWVLGAAGRLAGMMSDVIEAAVR